LPRGELPGDPTLAQIEAIWWEIALQLKAARPSIFKEADQVMSLLWKATPVTPNALGLEELKKEKPHPDKGAV
jgi:hypothetical protein